MQTLTNILQNFDLFPAPISFKFKSASVMKSVFSAIISLTIILPLIYFLVSDLLDVFNHERIKTKIKYASINNQGESTAVMGSFAVGVNYLYNNLQVLCMFLPTISIIKAGKIVQSYTLQPCLPSHWPNLSQQQFKLYKISNLLCPPMLFINSSPQFQGQLHNPSSTILALTLNTQQNPAPQCINYPTGQQYLLNNSKIGIQFQLYLHDKRIQQHNINAVDRFINQDIKVIIMATMTQQITVQFARYTVSTDDSFMPWTHVVVENGSYVDRISKNYVSFDAGTLSSNSSQQITNIYFVTNDKYTIYTRTVAKASESLTSAGGLLAFLFAISALLFFSFNLHVYQLQLSKQLFKNTHSQSHSQLQQSSSSSSSAAKISNQKNPLIFIKYNIFKTIQQLFNKKLQWQDCLQIDLHKKQANNLLDIKILLKRMQNLQLAVKHCVDKNQAVCLGLVQKVTFKQVKNLRVQGEYCDFIIKGKVGVSIEDLRECWDFGKEQRQGQGEGQGYRGSLKEFYQAKFMNARNKNKKGKKQKQQNNRLSELVPQSQQQIIKKQLFNSVKSRNNDKLVSQQHLMQNPDYLGQQNSNTNTKINKNQDKRPKPNKPQPQPQNPNQHNNISSLTQTLTLTPTQQNLKYLKLILQQLPQLKQQSRQIQLPQSFQLIQQKISKCFIKMREPVRLSLQEKIPIVILWRIVDCLQKNQYFRNCNGSMEYQQENNQFQRIIKRNQMKMNINKNVNVNSMKNNFNIKNATLQQEQQQQLQQQQQQQQDKNKIQIVTDNIDITTEDKKEDNINKNKNDQNIANNIQQNRNNINNAIIQRNIDDKFDQKYVQGNVYQQLLTQVHRQECNYNNRSNSKSKGKNK